MKFVGEITSALRNAIKIKLIAMGVYVDDELPDYIMVMVANKKTKEQMHTDLYLFLSSQTDEFTEWLLGYVSQLQAANSTVNDVKDANSLLIKHEAIANTDSVVEANSSKDSKSQSSHEHRDHQRTSSKSMEKSTATNSTEDTVGIKAKLSLSVPSLDISKAQINDISSLQHSSLPTTSRMPAGEPRFGVDLKRHHNNILNDGRHYSDTLSSSGDDSDSQYNPLRSSYSGRAGPVYNKVATGYRDLDDVNDDDDDDKSTRNTVTKKSHVRLPPVTLSRNNKDTRSKLNSNHNLLMKAMRDAERSIEERLGGGRSNGKRHTSSNVVFKEDAISVVTKSSNEVDLIADSHIVPPSTTNHVSVYERLGARRLPASSTLLHRPSERDHYSTCHSRLDKTNSTDKQYNSDSRYYRHRATSPRDLRQKYLQDRTHYNKKDHISMDKIARIGEHKRRKARETSSGRSSVFSNNAVFSNISGESLVSEKPTQFYVTLKGVQEKGLFSINKNVDMPTGTTVLDKMDTSDDSDSASTCASVTLPVSTATVIDSNADKKLQSVKLTSRNDVVKKNIARKRKQSELTLAVTTKDNAHLKQDLSTHQDKISKALTVAQEVPTQKRARRNADLLANDFQFSDSSSSHEDAIKNIPRLSRLASPTWKGETLQFDSDSDASLSEDNVSLSSNEHITTPDNVAISSVTIAATDNKPIIAAAATLITLPDGPTTFLRNPNRCRFWPNCTKPEGMCPYVHPSSIMCSMFPACRFGEACRFQHPMCRFDDSCAKLDCPYSHTKPRATPSTALSIRAPTVRAPVILASRTQTDMSMMCRFYPKCINVNCPYFHPQKVCRFGVNCGNQATCRFIHPSVPQKHLLKWTRDANQDDLDNLNDLLLTADNAV